MDSEAQQWIDLHTNMSNGTLDRSDYYLADTSQQGKGDVKMVSPTQAQVDQAKMQIKRKLSVVKKPLSKRRKQSGAGKKSKGKKTKPKKRVAQGQRGGKIVKKVKSKVKKIKRRKKL